MGVFEALRKKKNGGSCIIFLYREKEEKKKRERERKKKDEGEEMVGRPKRGRWGPTFDFVFFCIFELLNGRFDSTNVI